MSMSNPKSFFEQMMADKTVKVAFVANSVKAWLNWEQEVGSVANHLLAR